MAGALIRFITWSIARSTTWSITRSVTVTVLLGGLLLIGSSLLTATSARGDDEEPVRLDLRLMASDLVDEVVYSWLKTPPFASATPLIVAEITAPIGIDHRFDETIENHLFDLLRANPSLPLTLVHCSSCRQWFTVTTPEKTVIGRALDRAEGPDVLRDLPHAHALSLHFDVVGNDLILWAEIFEIAPPRKIVWAKRLSHSTSTRPLLQEPGHLVSIEQAREEQRQLLKGHDTLQAVTRFPIRNYLANATGRGAEIPPLIFLEQSFEAILLPRRNQRVGLSLGLTSLRGSLEGWSFGAHYLALLGRREPSLIHPDLYLRTGVTYLRLEGPGSLVFSQNQLDIARLANNQEEPRASLTAWQIGLEAHIKYRFGLAVFVEYVPALNESQIIRTERFLLPFHGYGFAGVFLW